MEIYHPQDKSLSSILPGASLPRGLSSAPAPPRGGVAPQGGAVGGAGAPPQERSPGGRAQGGQTGSPDLLVPYKISSPKNSLDPDEFLWSLQQVGTGFPKDDCGNFQARAGACNQKPGEHRPLLIPISCGRRACPEDWTTWAERAGDRVAQVLNSYLSKKFGNIPPKDDRKRERLLARHVSWHPEREQMIALIEDTLDAVTNQRALAPDYLRFQAELDRRFRVMASKVMTDAGALAWVQVTHEIRLQDPRGNHDADGNLEINRYRDILDCPDWRDHVKLYLHAHGLVIGALPPYGEFYEKTGGWTYRIHGTVTNPAGLIFYLVSHAPAADGVRSITYHGELGKRVMVKNWEYRARVIVPCHECEEEHHPDPIRVIANIHPGSLAWENDGNRATRLRRGRGELVDWSFDEISNKPYVKVRRLIEYRFLGPGERAPKRRDRWDRVTHCSNEYLQDRIDRGELPGEWFT